MKTPDNIVAIWGVPRSGTTWLGQIFNSSLNTIFRYQPLFSYAHKSQLSDKSTRDEIHSFMNDVTNTNDDFVLNGLATKDEKKQLKFDKSYNPSHLVIKHVRYHNIIENLLQKCHNIKLLGIVRNPCGVINSWLGAPKEFDSSWNPLAEWRNADLKNRSKDEEFYGFEKWKETTLNFIAMAKIFPDKITVIRFESLVENPVHETANLFSFVGLPFDEQTEKFLHDCHRKNDNNEYAVFKDKSVKDKWKTQLDQRIRDEIIADLKGTRLEKFLE